MITKNDDIEVRRAGSIFTVAFKEKGGPQPSPYAGIIHRIKTKYTKELEKIKEKRKDEAEKEKTRPKEDQSMGPPSSITVEATREGEPIIIHRGENVICFEKLHNVKNQIQPKLDEGAQFGVGSSFREVKSGIIDASVLNSAAQRRFMSQGASLATYSVPTCPNTKFNGALSQITMDDEDQSEPEI